MGHTSLISCDKSLVTCECYIAAVLILKATSMIRFGRRSANCDCASGVAHSIVVRRCEATAKGSKSPVRRGRRDKSQSHVEALLHKASLPQSSTQKKTAHCGASD